MHHGQINSSAPICMALMSLSKPLDRETIQFAFVIAENTLIPSRTHKTQTHRPFSWVYSRFIVKKVEFGPMGKGTGCCRFAPYARTFIKVASHCCQRQSPMYVWVEEAQKAAWRGLDVRPACLTFLFNLLRPRLIMQTAPGIILCTQRRNNARLRNGANGNMGRFHAIRSVRLHTH